MSEEQFKAFLQKVQDDTNLQEQLSAATSVEAVVELAKAAGFMMTVADLQRAHTAAQTLLSEAELENVSGGTLIVAETTPVVGWIQMTIKIQTK